MTGQEQNTDDRFVFWVRREGGDNYGGQACYAARYGPYKLLQNTPYESFQYFNLKEDPLEQNPLDPSNFMEFRELRIQLKAHIRVSGSVPWQE